MDPVHHIGDVVCAIIERNGRFLIAQRPEGKTLACKWEFPGGKLDAGEDEPAALYRELREELDITVRIEQRLTPVFHAYETFSLRLVPFVCSLASGEPVLHEHRALAWITTGMIDAYDFPEADLPVLEEYRQFRSSRTT
ncbi:MAG: (deoxy)nucleoside triphosphate pyrophosphohydrolase [Chlorobi bacterium]|nr:(deoxy)nucleoside triphosphate pyrophosphohydrolase [Chlorobiota bacterium]